MAASVVSEPASGFPETRASLLARLADAQDARSWEQFVATYRPIVYRLARRQGLQHADAEELGQDVMAAVARAIGAWVPRTERGRFRHWLLRIARNLSINLRTRAKYRTLSSGHSGMRALIGRQTCDGNELSQLFEAEYRRAIFRIAARQVQEIVAERTWQAFWLSTVEDVPIAEVAERLQMSAGGVYIARTRVMARLRQAVERIEAEETLSGPINEVRP